MRGALLAALLVHAAGLVTPHEPASTTASAANYFERNVPSSTGTQPTTLVMVTSSSTKKAVVIDLPKNISSNTQRRNFEVQVPPVLRLRTNEQALENEDQFQPVPGGRVSSYEIGAVPIVKSRIVLKPSSLESKEKELELPATNRSESNILAPVKDGYRDSETFLPEIRKTTKRDLEPRMWTEMGSNSYMNTVQTFSIGNAHQQTASSTAEEPIDESLFQSLADGIFSGKEGIDPDSIPDIPDVSGSVESDSGVSEGGERAQFASALKAVMAGDQAARAQRERELDLVLSGERALVTLWPQFGDLLERLLHVASETCKVIPVVSLIAQYQVTEAPRLRMLVYTARGKRVLRSAAAMLETVAAQELVVYVPGWWNTPSDVAARALRAAIVPRAGLLLVLDTRGAFCSSYLSAAARVPRVADYLARWLRRSGLPARRLHLLGFSLGAHVAALAALKLRAGGARPARLSALEPAAPCLQTGPWRRAADHVQVVHTSRSLALRRPLGHVDVYAAVRCAPACQHAASWRLFAASASHPAALTAARCRQAAELAAGRCSGPNATLGYPCRRDARGIFLLHPP